MLVCTSLRCETFVYQGAVPGNSLKFSDISKLLQCSIICLCDLKHLFWILSRIRYFDLVSHFLAQGTPAKRLMLGNWQGIIWISVESTVTVCRSNKFLYFHNKTSHVSAYDISFIGLLFTELYWSNITLYHIIYFSILTGPYASQLDVVFRNSIIFIYV